MKPESTLLDSGARVVTIQTPQRQAAALHVSIAAGSRHDPETLRGAHHFIEHMLFKGTNKRDALSISQAIESTGGDINASTGRENTTFEVLVPVTEIDVGLDVLVDMISNPRFAEDDFELEQEVILREIDACNDDPDELCADTFYEALFPSDPFGAPIAGSIESVSQATRDTLYNCYAESYREGDITFVAVGDVEHQAIVDLIAAKFSGHARRVTSNQGNQNSAPLARQHVDFDSELLHLQVGCPTLPMRHPLAPAATIIAYMLGGGSASRVFYELRERRGLAYSAGMSTQGYSDRGTLGIYAAVSPDDAHEALEAIYQILRDLFENGITDDELAKAKRAIRGRAWLMQESPSALAGMLIDDIISASPHRSMQERIALLDAVTLTEMDAYLRSLCEPSTIWSLVSVGSLSAPDDLALWQGISR